MNKETKVSVIIPVYNAEKYLRQCLDSVVNQTLRDIEIICVDDGSTDGSIEILREYEQKDSRVKVLCQKNQYAGVTRNNGLSHASGEYVFFMDSDDYCNLELLAHTVSKAQETDADIVVFNHKRCDEENGHIEEKQDINLNQLPDNCNIFNYRTNPRRIMSVINPVPWNKLLRRDFLLKWDLTFEPLSSTNDITFSALCAACAERITYLNESLITYRVNVKNSISSTKTKKLGDMVQAVCRTYYKAQHFPHYAEIEPSVQVFVANNLMFTLKNHAGKEDSPQYTEFLTEMGKVFWGLPLFYHLDETKVEDKTLCQFIRGLGKQAEESFDTSYFPQIVVSLTSYPKRIGTVNQVIETLLCQTLEPKMIVLWLADSQFPNRESDLPEQLTSLISSRFQIRWTGDTRSYKKLIPALKAFPEDIIITVDDDILYQPEMVERLVRGYRKYPECIQCHRCTTFNYPSLDGVTIIPNASKVYPIPTYLHKVTGCGGCLYPPHSLHPDALREELFMGLAPTNDDIWFWLMGALNGYKVNVVEGNLPRLHYVPGSQEDALWKQNDQGEKLFFVHFRNILRYYPILQDVLSYEYMMLQQAGSIVEKTDLRQLQIQLSVQRRRADANAAEIRAIHSSATYKIGRFVTFLPRKLRGGVRCYQEHGAAYTFQRLLVHLHLIEDPYSMPSLPVIPAASAKSEVAETDVKKSEPVKSAKAPVPVRRDYQHYMSLPKEQYEEELKLWYQRVTGQVLDLDQPQTFNEKIQWLKLYDSTPLKTRLADKYLVRDWVKEKIGEEHLIPLLGVWDSFDKIDFDKLPNQFVLKANHASGWNIIVKDKKTFDKVVARKKFSEWMNKRFAFAWGLELHYMNIPPKIIAEQYMADLDGDIFDYRFFCFNGTPRYVWVDIGSGTKHHKRNIYDINWNLQAYQVNYPPILPEPEKPETFEEMVALASTLCRDFAFVRVDFYSIKDKVYFGEMTFTPQSGTGKWGSEEQNRIYGDLIQLPPKSPIPEKQF